jgi:hypothetical protein
MQHHRGFDARRARAGDAPHGSMGACSITAASTRGALAPVTRPTGRRAPGHQRGDLTATRPGGRVNPRT